jgi:hypothetical protein
MRLLSRFVLITGAALLAAGCASGPKFSEIASSIPTLKAGEGRIYFYRTSMLGAAIQPTINLNGVAVGTSQSGGFFFVDRSPGNYEIVMASEVERKVTFVLAAGEQKYIRTSVGIGLFVGRPQAELVSAEEGRKEVSDLSYTGEALKK